MGGEVVREGWSVAQARHSYHDAVLCNATQVPLMALVELVLGIQTSDETFGAWRATWARRRARRSTARGSSSTGYW